MNFSLNLRWLLNLKRRKDKKTNWPLQGENGKSKDYKGLQELGDLLLELQCAKEDGGLAGLKILDEPAFLKPVLAKLPEELQGR